MKRRDVLKSLGSSVVAASSLAVGGQAFAAKPEFKWKNGDNMAKKLSRVGH
jgi:hypothetical protein